jgi:exosortase A
MSAIPVDLRLTSPWRTALPAFALLEIAVLLLYRDTAATMVGIWWRSETFQHAFLVLPIFFWLVWRRREALAAQTPRANPWVLLALVAAAALWLASELVAVNVASQFALVAMLVLAVPAVLGVHVARIILFPLLFLFFAVPFGEFMLPWLMERTADFTVSALQMSGVPVFREGQRFVIPSGSWSVVEECSGVRYLIASFMVGSLYAYITYQSQRRRAVFMAASLLVPIVANWVRAYLIVMLGHLSGNRIAAGVDHVLYGWVFFGVIIFVMFKLGARWSEPDRPAAGAPGGSRASAASAPWSAPRVVASVLAVAVIAVLPPLTLAALAHAEGVAARAAIQLPDRLAAGWSAPGARIVEWAPRFVAPSAQAARAYAGAPGTVGVYVAYYRGQTNESKLVSSLNVLADSTNEDWNMIAVGQRPISVNGRDLTVRTAEILARPQGAGVHRPHLVAWRTYWIDGRLVAGDAAAKLASAVARLRGRGDDGAALVLYADEESVEASNAALQAFIEANGATLNALLERTRDAR